MEQTYSGPCYALGARIAIRASSSLQEIIVSTEIILFLK